MSAQLVETAQLLLALTVLVAWVWPLGVALSHRLEPLVFRFYGLPARKSPVLPAERGWRDYALRACQLALLVPIYVIFAEAVAEPGRPVGGQADFWIAVSAVYAVTYWVARAADLTARLGAWRRKGRAPGSAAGGALPARSAPTAIAPPSDW